MKALTFIFLIFLSINVFGSTAGRWEFKHPLSKENYNDLLKKMSRADFSGKKKRTVYFFDSPSLSFYKQNSIIFRLRTQNVEQNIDVKFRNINGNELDFLIRLGPLPEGHSMRCENDLVINQSPLTSCTLRVKKVKKTQLELKANDLFTTYQFNLVKLFLSKFRNIQVVTDGLLPHGPIISIAHDFEFDKVVKIKKPELSMEKWKLKDNSIHETSMKTKTANYERDMKKFKKIVKPYERDLENMSTKTKWAFSIFEKIGGTK